MPMDGDRATDIAFNDNEIFDLTKLTDVGKADENYLIEYQESGNPVVVYRSHLDNRTMVKVGYCVPEYNWISVLVVLPEEMDPKAFDFASAMREELNWLVELGVITGLDPQQIPDMTRDLAPGVRFFSQGMILSYLNCFTPDDCVRCQGGTAYTKLPPESMVKTSVKIKLWSKLKALFR